MPPQPTTPTKEESTNSNKESVATPTNDNSISNNDEVLTTPDNDGPSSSNDVCNSLSNFTEWF